MIRGLVVLLFAYVFSQFFRAFLPVVALPLAADIGARPDDLAFASSIWFVMFAAMQIPVGAALDKIGPRLTASVLFLVGGAGGAAMFAMAQTPTHIVWAMGLIGIGCSPVLMAAYYIIARGFSVAAFATLAGGMIGVGSIGNVAGSAPMAWAVQAFGWRATMMALAVICAVIVIGMLIGIKDPEKTTTQQRGSVIELLKIPVLWPIFAMMFVNYAPAAGLRGLWAGPYLADVYGADVPLIGLVTLVMGLAMIAGSFAFGPLEQVMRTRKWVVIGGNGLGAIGLIALWAYPAGGIAYATIMLALIGIGGSTFAVMIAHAKAFFPSHLTGRGVTLMNLFGIGGVGVMQFATGRVFTSTAAQGPQAAYGYIFAAFAALVIAGLCVYATSRDSTG